MPTVSPGTAVAVSCDTMGSRPKWMGWTAAGSAGGTAELPSGHRRLVKLNGTTRATEDYYVTPATIGSTDGAWRAVIYAPNGSHIYADGLRGFATIGTPTVRLQADAPAKAVLTIPASRSGGILAPDFAGWSDGHTGPARRGMELTVEYRRNDGTMALVFRGMIYQVQSGETIQIIAYDRLMDLYQFSDQYQSHQGYREETLLLASTTATAYNYTATEEPGAIVSAVTTTEIRISDLAYETVVGTPATTTAQWIVHDLPLVQGVTPKEGSRIKSVSMVAYDSDTMNYRGEYRIGLFKVLSRPGGISSAVLVGETASQYVYHATATLTWSVDWTIDGPAADYVIGIRYRTDGNQSGATYKGATDPQTVPTSRYYFTYGDKTGSDWNFIPYESTLQGWSFPEVAVTFDYPDTIPTADVGISGAALSVPLGDVTTPSGAYISTLRAAYQLAIAYQVFGGTDIYTVVHEMIEHAGLVPDIPAGALLGQTTYYTSSTYDYLTCVQELIKGGNYGARASIEEPGCIIIRPRHTIDDTPAASFSTAPGGSGEHAIVSHNMTAHWMAEKATQAIIAEDATTSGLPLAIETDDALMDGSLCRELQSPLRGITADSSMGTHLLLATAAGGKMVQLHTNIYEGEIVLAGYRSEIWNLAGDHAGGKPISIEVPEYGAQGTAVPTAVEFGGGCTRVSLDNIRTADRSEVARSMGLTGDAISNTARTLPNTSYIFARYDDYTTQETGLAPGSVTAVEFLADGGTVLASQTDTNFIKTAEDAAGYLHICTVMPATIAGYAASTPIAAVRFTMGGTARTAVLDNPKYALGGQALHADIRVRRA